MRQPRYLIGAVAGCIVLAGLATAAVLLRPGAVAQSGGVRIGGPFTLVDGSGKTVTDKDFRGRLMLVYFGYTHCPGCVPDHAERHGLGAR